jgi:hypothetical protein
MSADTPSLAERLIALAAAADRLTAGQKTALARISEIPDRMDRAKALGALADDLAVSMAPLMRGGLEGYWRPAPRSRGARVHRTVVYRLVDEGRLVWGNRCHSFAVSA